MKRVMLTLLVMLTFSACDNSEHWVALDRSYKENCENYGKELGGKRVWLSDGEAVGSCWAIFPNGQRVRLWNTRG